MKYLIILSVTIIVFILLRELYLTRETISYKIKSKGANGVPTINSNLSIIEEYSRIIPNCQKYTFIDIGCGEGKVLDYVYNKNLYSKYIGIEIEPEIYNIASKNLSNKKIELFKIDASQYKFKNVPTIIYMNEPLFYINKIDAYIKYDKWFRKFKNIDDIYIIYLTASLSSVLLDSKVIAKNNFKIVKQKRIGGYFIYRTMNLIEKSNSI